MISLVLPCLVGCAGSNFIALPDAVPSQIKSSKIILISTNNELQLEVESSNVASYMGGGLIPALIDDHRMNKRRKQAKKEIAPIRECLETFNMDKVVQKKIFATLKNASWMHSQQVNISKQDKQKTMNNHLKKNLNVDVIGIADASYTLSADFSILKMALYFEIYPHSERIIDFANQGKKVNYRKAKLKPIYKVGFVAKRRLANATTKMDNISIWSKNNGKQLRETINELTDSVSANLAKVLQEPSKEL